VGWLLGDEELIDKVVRAKQAADLHTCGLSQYITLELLRAGCVERQLPRLRQAYAERRDAMVDSLEKELDVEFTRPKGGMFLLVTLPKGMEARALLPKAIERGVAFVPGEEFHLDGAGTNTMRLSYSNATPENIRLGVARLAEAIRNM
jgi:2-aminoadipate transaminase